MMQGVKRVMQEVNLACDLHQDADEDSLRIVNWILSKVCFNNVNASYQLPFSILITNTIFCMSSIPESCGKY